MQPKDADMDADRMANSVDPVQARLCLAWSETPEDTFCRVVAH